MIICIQELSNLLRGWYLIQEKGRPVLMISAHEKLKPALTIASYTLGEVGIERIPTLQQLVEHLKASSGEDDE